jgi:tol-pal system protein YbgF
MRRSPRLLSSTALALSCALLASPLALASPSRSDREEADQQRQQAAAAASARASSRLMAEVLIQEEIVRKQRLDKRDAAAARVATEKVAAQEIESRGPTGDTGLDAVFGRNEKLTAPTGSEDRFYMPESIPGYPTAEPAPSTAARTSTVPAAPPAAIILDTTDSGTTQPGGSTDLELFHSGYSHYSQADFEAARQAFASFLAANPGDELADSAQYWLGQCAAAEGDYALALVEYRRVIESFPFGDKVPDALLKSGEALMELGRKAEARRAWEQLAREFPDTGAGRKARAQLGDGADVAAADAL